MIIINFNTKDKIINIYTGKLQNGGAGSGNWGHDGRPGKIGGSSKDGGGIPSEHKKERRNYGRRLRELSEIFGADNIGKIYKEKAKKKIQKQKKNIETNIKKSNILKDTNLQKSEIYLKKDNIQEKYKEDLNKLREEVNDEPVEVLKKEDGKIKGTITRAFTDYQGNTNYEDFIVYLPVSDNLTVKELNDIKNEELKKIEGDFVLEGGGNFYFNKLPVKYNEKTLENFKKQKRLKEEKRIEQKKQIQKEFEKENFLNKKVIHPTLGELKVYKKPIKKGKITVYSCLDKEGKPVFIAKKFIDNIIKNQ